MLTAAHFIEQALRCRRVLRSTGDRRAIEHLTALAEEFETGARALALPPAGVDVPDVVATVQLSSG